MKEYDTLKIDLIFAKTNEMQKKQLLIKYTQTEVIYSGTTVSSSEPSQLTANQRLRHSDFVTK